MSTCKLLDLETLSLSISYLISGRLGCVWRIRGSSTAPFHMGKMVGGGLGIFFPYKALLWLQTSTTISEYKVLFWLGGGMVQYINQASSNVHLRESVVKE